MEAATLNIRLANVNDIDQLIKLRLDMRTESEPDINLNEMKTATIDFFNRKLDNQTHLEFIAEENSKIVSTLGASLFELPPITSAMNGKTARMINLYTIPEFRRKGIATQLLFFAINHLRELGYAKITIHPSEIGKKLFKKNDFIVSDGEYHKNI